MGESPGMSISRSVRSCQVVDFQGWPGSQLARRMGSAWPTTESRPWAKTLARRARSSSFLILASRVETL